MTDKLREHLLENYAVPITATLRQDQRGMINQTWFVAGDLVMSVFQKRSPLEVAYISAVVQYDRSCLLPQIVTGKNGPVTLIDGKPAVIWRRFPGNHYVGRDHSHKMPVPMAGHASIADSFWRLHESLAASRKIGAWLGQMNYIAPAASGQPYIAYAELPAYLHKNYITDYLQTPSLPLRYPAFVHRDFERQNVLNAPDGIVTGVVDADALMMGDLLFEYAHCLMNFVFSDPQYQPRHVDIYMSALVKAGMVNPDDIKLLPGLIRSFAAKDLVDYFRYDHPPKTDLSRLAAIYDIALERVDSYFSGTVLKAATRPERQSRKAKPNVPDGA